LPRVDFVIEPGGCHLDFATSGFGPLSDMARRQFATGSKADIGEIENLTAKTSVGQGA
jgi:hypothetical protein